MSIKSRLVKAAVVGGIGWFISQLGFYICLFAGGALGAVTYEFFSVVAFWPLAFFTLFGSSESLQWPMLNIISLIGWLLLALIPALMFHFYQVVVAERLMRSPSPSMR